MNGKPRRLNYLFQNYAAPVYFITAVTAGRRQLLAAHAIHETLKNYAKDNVSKGRVMGRYVIMPDHMHFFVRLAQDVKVGDYVRWLKTAITRCLIDHCSPDLRSEGNKFHVWQPGFFDHVMRSQESYSQKWDYVRMNPVRAGLIDEAEKWPFQGEIERIEM